MSRRTAPAAFRGLTTTAFTGALAVAAHAVAGGGWPTGGAAVLLAATASVVGLIAMADRVAATSVLLALLAGGQVAAHLSLAAASHTHDENSGVPTALMFCTHAVAVFVGAMLTSAAERVCRALCRAARRCLTVARTPVRTRTLAAITTDDQPLQHVLLLAASISHRGPPACVSL